jgi:putative heme-binding domain-containing protein
MRKRLPPTELFAIGFFTSATGLTIYRGTAYPPEYRGNAFIGDVGGNLVHRKTLSPQGAHYLATRADQNVEFLASTDNWFRPVNFANTPDGTLLILDMYRETIEHPWSIPEPIKKHLDLTSGQDRGRLYNLVFNGAARHRKPNLSGASIASLVSLLADPDAWWRETAQRLLIERRDTSSVPMLKDMVARRPTALGRLHALWTLDVLGSLESGELIQGLQDPEPRVREQSTRLAERRISADESLLAQVLSLAADADPMVRFQTALSLGAAGQDPRVMNALARIAVQDAADTWTRTAVLSSISKRAPALIEILAASPGFFETEAGQSWLDELSVLVGSERDPAQARGLVARLMNSNLSQDHLIKMLAALGRGLRRSGHPLAEALHGIAPEQVRSIFGEAVRLAASDEPADRRLPAIALMGMEESAVRWNVLRDLLDARQPVAVQLAALRALSVRDDPVVGGLVVGQWKSMSPLVRREAIEVLFSRPGRLDQLVTALESKQLTSGEIDPARLKQLRTHADAKLRARVLKILGGEADATRDRQVVIDALRPALALGGNSERGRGVFVKACATCHRASSQGTEVGPDLATVTGRSPEDLLLHILDPNREVAPNYVNYNVATTDGRVISGIIASETASALTLKRAEGVTEVVPRAQVEVVASTGLSLMPEGLEKGLTTQDFADLIAYLKSIPAPGH